MVAMSYHYLQFDRSGILRMKEIANQDWFLLMFRTHILLGLIAITIGPFQFMKSIRIRRPSLHRKLGYLYIFSVLLSSIAGLIIAQFAMGGWISTIGFSLLAFGWFYTTAKAVIAIKAGQIQNHQMWMFFSYALTFASITQRTLLLIPLLTTIPFIPIYQLSAWLPWVVNLSVAYVLHSKISETRPF
ncbi:MAG: DUF2306 domain-containing protein [Calditrichia bacterium]